MSLVGLQVMMRQHILIALFAISASALFSNDLFNAAEKGDVNVVRELLEAGADIHVLPEYGGYLAPLHIATAKGHMEAMKLLLSREDDPDFHIPYGCTALRYAVNEGHAEEVQYLLAQGAKIRNADICDDYLTLHSAVSGNYFEVTEMLLDGGANLYERNKFSMLPLDIAVNSKNHKMARLLLEYYNKNSKYQSNCGDKQFCVAVIDGYVDLVRLLIQNGADPKQLDADGVTTLHLAARHGNEVVLDVLLGTGMDINMPTNSGDTALHLAAQYGHEYTVKLLLKKWAHKHKTNQKGLTPLQVAEENGQSRVVVLLQ